MNCRKSELIKPCYHCFVIYSDFISKTTMFFAASNSLFFCSLKFECSLFSNKRFACIFRGEGILYTAEKGPNKTFLFKTSQLKSNSFVWELLLDFAASTVIKDVSFSLWSLTKDFYTIQGTAYSWNAIHYERPQQQIEYIIVKNTWWKTI